MDVSQATKHGYANFVTYHKISKHVHSDLSSYVCTNQTCASLFFDSRHKWFEHELETHRKQWICSFCEETTSTEGDLIRHLPSRHFGSFYEPRLPAIVASSGRPLQHIAASACPLCDYETMIRRKLSRTNRPSSPAQGGFDDICELLLDIEVNTVAKSPYRLTALDIARQNGHASTAQLLENASRAESV